MATEAHSCVDLELQLMRDRVLTRLFKLMDRPLGAVFGAMAYGFWAFFINRHAGLPNATLIGVCHWLVSVVLTISCVTLMRTLFRLAERPRNGALLAVAGDLTLTYTLLVGVHLWIGTPNIFWTLAPGVLPTIAFAALYASLLMREARQPASAAAVHGSDRPAASGRAGESHVRA